MGNSSACSALMTRTTCRRYGGGTVWRPLPSPLTLSRANVLTQENHFVAALAISMMGQTQELLRQPEDTFEEYRYEYNDKHYPTKKIGDTEIIYTYKN